MDEDMLNDLLEYAEQLRWEHLAQLLLVDEDEDEDESEEP